MVAAAATAPFAPVGSATTATYVAGDGAASSARTVPVTIWPSSAAISRCLWSSRVYPAGLIHQ